MNLDFLKGLDLSKQQELISSMILSFIPKVFMAAAVLFFGWFFASWMQNRVSSFLQKTPLDITIVKFLSSLVKYLVIIMVILSCLNIFGIKTTSLAALLGAAGLAVGLAFQGTLSNLAAGFMLLLFQPFRVGDFIEVAGEQGTVEEIRIFTTSLKNLSNVKVIIPNNNVFGSTIKNYAGYSNRRVDVNVGVSYNSDMDATRKALAEAVAETELGVKDPGPQVVLKSLGDSAVNWQVRVWCSCPDYWIVHEDMVYEIKKALDAANIEIPFPQMDVHVKK